MTTCRHVVVTVEREYEVMCGLSNVLLNITMTLNDPDLDFKVTVEIC